VREAALPHFRRWGHPAEDCVGRPVETRRLLAPVTFVRRAPESALGMTPGYVGRCSLLDSRGARARVALGDGDFLIQKNFAGGIGRFFAAHVAANQGDAGIVVGDIAGCRKRNKRTAATEKTNNTSVFVSWLLGHTTLPTRIRAQLRGTAIIQSQL
jgi:hypothetical protein